MKDRTMRLRLKLSQKADSIPQRPRVCLSLCLSCDCDPLPFRGLLLLEGLSRAPPPSLQLSFAQCPVLPQFLHVLMSVHLVLVVLVVRFLSGVGFYFALSLTFLERVNLHLVICARTISR